MVGVVKAKVERHHFVSEAEKLYVAPPRKIRFRQNESATRERERGSLSFFLCSFSARCGQVQRGYAVLEELENAMGTSGGNRAALLETLSARFYQVPGDGYDQQIDCLVAK